MDVKSAEFTKYAANAMLANLTKKQDTSIEMMSNGIGYGGHIDYGYLRAACGSTDTPLVSSLYN